MNKKNLNKSIISNKIATIFDFHGLKLQGKFFLYFAGLVILVVGFVSGAVFYFQKQMLLKQAQEKAFSLTRTLAYTSLNAILQDDYIVIQNLIDSMMDGPDIVSIALLDTTGKIIAAGTPELRGQHQLDPLTKKALSSETILLQKVSATNGDEVWDTAVPIFKLNQRLGTARIKYSVQDTYQGLFQTILIIGIVAVVLSLALAYRFSRSISRPIEETVNLANEYGRGNLDATLQTDRQDEIGELVHSLNKLSQELKTLIEEKITNENLILMGEFASYIIHDLKNPLSGIHLLADGLNRKIPADGPLRKYSTEILLASQKLQEFIERTLDMARWSRLNIQSIQIQTLIESAAREVNFTSIPVTKKYDSNMPEIQGDYQVLSMAIKNLLTNAVEAIDGDGEIRIETLWSNKAVIKISDTGRGIPEDRLKTIFRPFFSMKNQGHGLGLAMVKKAVILHQGEIKVESKFGMGSTFTIAIPGNLQNSVK